VLSVQGSSIIGSDLRAQHLALDVTRTSDNAYGVVFEIEGPITTPSGKTCGSARSGKWTLERTCPRFITMYPR
jgi:hypothetical protein